MTLPAAFDCRKNSLARLGLQQNGFIAAVNAAVDKCGAHRVADFMGTSTSGIHKTGRAYMELAQDTDALPGWYRYETRGSMSFAAAGGQWLHLDVTPC